MKKIVLITHHDDTDIKLITQLINESDLAIQSVRPYLGETLPSVDDTNAVIALGGPQGAYEDHSYLRTEEEFLANAVDRGIPVLGICLGSQLLATALGGTAYPGDTGFEAGIITVRSTSEDFPEMNGEFFSFHGDSMTPPPDAEVMAISDRYIQAWRYKSALAIQFHPEISQSGAQELLGLEADRLAQSGVDVPQMRADVRSRYAEISPSSLALLSPWFDQVVGAKDSCH